MTDAAAAGGAGAPVVVAGRYELLGVLGRGAASQVHEGRDLVTGERVAVKLLDEGTAAASARVHREISALRLLRLPGVVTLRDEGVHGGSRYLVMDLVAGRAFPGCPVPVTWEALAPTALALLEVLSRVHAAGVVHRDLKPPNVLVDDAGKLTVLDFGISWGPALGEAVTTAGAIVGTPEYLAPEQFVGATADARTDLYAVGVMFYEALAGRPPHTATEFPDLVALKRSRVPPPLRIVSPSTPREVAQVVDQLLAIDPEDRPRSAGETVEILWGSRPRGASSRTLPRLGGEAAVVRVVEAALAGRSLDVAGPQGSGRSRLLAEAADRLAELGRTVLWLVPGSAPYSGLAALLGGLDELRDATHADAVRAIEGRVEIALRSGTVLFADDAERIDRWSAEVLDACRDAGAVVRVIGTPAGDALCLGEIAEEDLRPLFRGPDRIFHLREDGARELWRRTGGLPSRVTAELAAWVRAGLAHWEGGEVVIRRDALDRLRGGQPVGDELLLHPGVAKASTLHLDDLLAWVVFAWPHATAGVLAQATGQPRWSLDPGLQALEEDGLVRRLPDGSLQPLSVPRSVQSWSPERRREVHRALAGALAPGTPRRLRHLAASGAPEEVVEESLLLAAELLRLGKSGEAVVVVEEGLAASRRCRDEAVLRPRVVVAFAKAMLDQGTQAAFDRALYEVSRTERRRGDLVPLDELLRSARGIASGDSNRCAEALRTLGDLGSFEDFELEMWRHAQRMRAARRLTRADEEKVLADVEAWARRTANPRARTCASAWRGVHLSALGRRAEAAQLHLEAATSSPRIHSRMAAWLNAATAFHQCGRLDAAVPAAQSVLQLARACRDPSFEAHAESLIRAIRYQQCAAGAPDVELVEAAAGTENPTILGPTLMTEAAVAWRAGDAATARSFAGRAATMWERLGDSENHALSRAFALVCGETAAPGEIDRLADAARKSEDARGVVETLGLLALTAPTDVAAGLRQEAAVHADRLEQEDRDLRMDVISVREALEGLVPGESQPPR